MLGVAAQLSRVEAHLQQRGGNARASRQGRTQFGFEFRSADHPGPGQIEPTVGSNGGNFVIDSAIERRQLGGAPTEPSPPIRGLGQECGSIGEALWSIARNAKPRVLLEPGDGCIVEAPVWSRQLGVAVGGKPQSQPSKRGMRPVAGGQLTHYAQHCLLHAGMEHVVVGGQPAPRWPNSALLGALGTNPSDTFGRWTSGTSEGLKFRQRRGEFNGGNELQLLAIEQP
jgi:hypothetical protein